MPPSGVTLAPGGNWMITAEHRKRRKRQLLFAKKVQRSSARRDHFDARASCKDFSDLRNDCQNLLEIVKHEKKLCAR